MSGNWALNLKLASIAVQYRAGAILLSDAAKEARITPVEFMEYLAGIGHVSEYSVKDFDESQALLDEFLDYKPPHRAATKKTARTRR